MTKPEPLSSKQMNFYLEAYAPVFTIVRWAFEQLSDSLDSTGISFLRKRLTGLAIEARMRCVEEEKGLIDESEDAS